jgi:hypothetical protein
MTTAHLKTRTILFDYPVSALIDDNHARRGSPDPEEATDRRSPAAPPPTNAPAGMLGRCLHARDPLGSNRVLVEYQDATGEEYHLWLTPLQELQIAADDELLLIEPRGSREPIIAGIVSRRNPRPSAWPAELTLAAGESLTITAANGTKLIEIIQHEGGPMVRLCPTGVAGNLPGMLHIDAQSIERRAHASDLCVQA